MDVQCINVITLAYMGDAIYEVYIREKCISLGIAKVEDLQKKVTSYVSALGQSKVLERLVEKNFLSDSELLIVKRGRNYKRSVHPKNTSLAIYKEATGLETLIGYLYLSKNFERLNEIFEMIGVE